MEQDEKAKSEVVDPGAAHVATKQRFLVIATEWFSGKGGLSTFNRELCEGLARLGCDVTCYVEAAESDEISDAKEKGVNLVQPPEAKTLGRGALLLPIKAAHPFDFIVGHGRVTGPHAAALVEHHYPDCQRVHFIHVAPQCIEWHKGNDDASEVAETRKREETNLVLSSDFAFAVGPLLRDEYATALHIKKKHVHEFRPGLFEVERMESPPRIAQCLVLGRAEDIELKGLDIAACALAAINRAGRNCKLIVRGAPQHKGAELRDSLKALGSPSPLEIQVWEFSSDRNRILADVHETSLLLMPSRSEGFGLVALEAISASVPVLLSARSGLAQLLSELLPNDPDALSAVVPVTEHLGTDVSTWETVIASAIANREDAFKRAARLRAKLADHLSWDDAVQDFLDVLTRGGPIGGTMSLGEGPTEPSAPSAVGEGALAAFVPAETPIGINPEISIADDAEGVDAELREAMIDVRAARSGRSLERIDRLIRDRGDTLTPAEHRSALSTKAVAYIITGDAATAANLLEKAHEVDPTTADGVASGAFAALLRGARDEAYELARHAVAIDPHCERALTAFVDAAPIETQLDELVMRVSPEGHLASGPAAALAIAAEQRGLLDRAVEFARTADRSSPWPNVERKVRLASVLLQGATESDEPPEDLVREAASTLKDAVGILENGDQPERLGQALSLLALSHELLGAKSVADTYTERALVLAPNDSAVLFRAAATRVERGEPVEASKLLKRIETQTPESQLLEAEVLRSTDRSDEALALMETLDPETLPTPLLGEWARIHLSILARRKQWAAASACIERALACEPTSVFLLAAAARLQRQSGGSGQHFLARAMDAIRSASAHELKFLLDELVRCESWERAGTVMALLGTGPGSATPLDTQLWVTYNRGDLDEALILCRRRREEVGVSPDFLGIEASVLEEIGALSDAARLLDEGLSRWSTNSELLLRRGMVALRQRDFETRSKCLASLPTHFQNLELNKQYVFLLISASRFAEAARAAYEQRRTQFSDASSHSAYVRTLLRLPADLFPKQQEVTVDAAVQIRSEAQGEAWWIIDAEADANLAHRELQKGSALREAIEGRRVGEQIEVASLGQVEVCEVVSKYVYAFRESMSLFGSALSDESVRPVRVDGPKGLEPILEVIRTHGERTTAVLDLYNSGRVTVGACSAMLRVSQFEMVASMISDPSMAIRCADGAQASYADAMSILEAKPRLVCDPVSLMVLNALRVGPAIASTFGKLLIPQSIVDKLQEGALGDVDSRGRAPMSLHYSEGRYYRRENTPEEAEQRQAFWLELLEFVRDYCEVVPCWTALKLSRSSRVEHAEVLDSPSFDSVLVAAEPGRVLLSDDLMLRLLAANEFRVQGGWTQVALAYCHSRNILDDRAYAEATMKLVLAGLTFVTINGTVLAVAAEQDSLGPGPHFRKVSDLLSAASVDFSSAVVAAVEFIAWLWANHTVPDVKRNTLLTVLFNALSVGRQGKAVSRQVERRLRIRLRLAQPALREVLDVLFSWRAANLA